MTRLPALEIEAYALSSITAATDEEPRALSPGRKFAPSQTPSRGRAVPQWIAIALLFVLNLVLCFAVGSGGPLQGL